jgi:hypothetical protein
MDWRRDGAGFRVDGGTGVNCKGFDVHGTGEIALCQ